MMIYVLQCENTWLTGTCKWIQIVINVFHYNVTVD